MKNAYAISAALLLSLGSCQTWKAAPRKPDIRVCGDTAASVPHLTWTPATDMPNMKAPLPASYSVYVVPLEEADAFFKAVGKAEALDVRIPLPSGCTVFHVTGSGAMSEALKEKYPDLVSAKGTAPGADLRLDWDGKTFRGQVLSGGVTHLIEPRSAGGKTWYLFYEARSGGQPKQPFERQKAPTFDR